MKAKLLAATVLFLIAGISSTNAQIRQQAKNERYRIGQGVRSGELTRNEARNLTHDQREIHQDIRSARADGIVTHCERKEIRQDQRQASRKIYRKKHNCRDRN
jgi:uncharacterized membrane protein YebE (DUF533 family)